MVIKCKSCKLTKCEQDFYTDKRNGNTETNCKVCRNLKITAKRYNLEVDQLRLLYTHKNCMCCKEEFYNTKLRHVHHTDKGVKGIICYKCNYILGQESGLNIHRIKTSLRYIDKPSENLIDRDNQQERLNKVGKVTKFVVVSSETTRHKSQNCKQCNRHLTIDSFDKPSGRGYRKVCVECRRFNWRLLNNPIIRELRETTIICDCCELSFTSKNKKCVHHINESIRGIVCNRCNQLLGDETNEQKNRLQLCLNWIETVDYDIVRSMQRCIEVGRNDQPCSKE